MATGARAVAALAVCALGCSSRSAAERDQDDYVDDVVAFTHKSEAQVRGKLAVGMTLMKAEWDHWAQRAPMTPERGKAFYKETWNYIYELGAWHLWSADKRRSDLALVDEIATYKPHNILDFGGGVALNAIPLARAGFDVTLADLDSTTLRFGVFHATRRGVSLKIWKSDVEPAPPDKTYDVILVMDVLEHLPADELTAVVDKLVKLKTPSTKIILHAPFGKTDDHPMHIDENEHTKHQVHRLETELPPS